MTQVVQAKCPHCHNVLRIPAEWLAKSMRCKFCKNVFEARAGAGDTPLPPTTAIGTAPVPRAAVPIGRAVAATAITAAAPARAAEAFEPVIAVPSFLAARKRGGGGRGKIVALAGCAVLLVLTIPASLVALYAFGAFGSFGGGGGDPGEESENTQKFVLAKDVVTKDPSTRDKKANKKDKSAKGIEGKGGGLLPRRALLISVDNYLYLNSVHYGSARSKDYAGSSLSALAATFPNPPLRIPATQIFQLSDGAPQPHTTELSVLKAAIKDFLDTSRAQDRIIILFAGHGTDIEKESYLIPISGRKEDADTLLPLSWVYEQMAKAKAREKVLILDLFRFPPALGFELPGAGASEEGEMGEVFDKNLQNPPPGVQVWSSSIKGQRSIEFEGGSVFLQALNHTLQGGPGMTGFIEGSSPLPFNQALVTKVNQRIKDLVGPQKFEQTSRLVGSAPSTGAAYDPAEPLALPITLKQPAVPGGESASYAEINSILNEIKLVPPTRRTRAGEKNLLQAANLPPFPAKVLNTYKADGYKSVDDLLKRYKADPKGLAKEHPVRAVVLDAIEALQKSDRINMRESLNGPIDAKQKAAFLNEQKEPGVMIFELEKVLSDMRTVLEEDMDKETSKRWRANFDYAMARVEARLVYIYEYSYLIGQIRLDALPALEKDQDGWRVGSRKKIQVTEPKAKTYAKEVAKAWQNLQKSYPDTPWAVVAHRESLVALGLEWRAKKE